MKGHKALKFGIKSICCIALLGGPFAATSAAPAISLNTFVNHALNTNPDIRASHYALKATHHQVDKARGAYFPTITFNAGMGPRKTSTPLSRVQAACNCGVFQKQADVTIDQTLYDGGARASALAEQKANKKTADYQLNETRVLTAFTAVESYLNVMRAKQILATYSGELTSHRRTLKRVRVLLNGGVGRLSQVQLAKAKLASVKAQWQAARNQLNQAENQFIQVGNFPANAKLSLPAAVPTLPLHYADVWQTASEHNPTLQATQMQLKAAKARIENAKSGLHPTLFVSMNADHSATDQGFNSHTNNMEALLNIKFQPDLSGQVHNQLRTERAKYFQAKFLLEAKKRQIEQEVKNTWDSLSNNQHYLRDTLTHRVNAKRVLKSYREEFDVGKRSLFDLLTAESDYNQARLAVINAQFDLMISRYRLMAGMGVLANYFQERGASHA